VVEESTRDDRAPLRGLRTWTPADGADGRQQRDGQHDAYPGGQHDGKPDGEVHEAARRLVSVLVDGRGGGRLDAERVLGFATRAVPGAGWSGITLLREGRRPTGVVSVGEVGAEVDALQHELREGPCIDAAARDDVVVVTDLAGDERYPRFGPRCVQETGVRSILAVRTLLDDGERRAALNLYAERPDAFSPTDVAVAVMFAPFVGMAVQAQVHAQEAAHLQLALESSRQIGSAVGILMANDRLTADAAFSALVQASRTLNRKLRDIADEVTRTGALPAPARRSG
jgi:GAF domain-containing protein